MHELGVLFNNKEKFNSEKNGFGQLTAREVELIRLIGEELTMKEIAAQLFLSEHRK